MTQGRGKMTQGRDRWQSICLRIALIPLDVFASRLHQLPALTKNVNCSKSRPLGCFGEFELPKSNAPTHV